jgi:pimeloyl-ACP methyl ester carboxylesterase
MESGISSQCVNVDELRLHYLTCGTGDPVVLLHGWPTSSFLWRNVMGPMAQHNQVIALDLPGFGKSDKPEAASYSFRFHERVFEGFLDTLGIGATSLVVHDLGGPVGLYWACHHRDRLQRLALLNTIVYPEMSYAVVAFVAACRIPGVRALLASPWGLRRAMRFGVSDPARLSEEAIRGVLEPFENWDARYALLKAGYGLNPKGFRDIARLLPSLDVPVRIIYGERDRILPDVAETMRRVVGDLPQAEVTALPGCGHFLQEERPDEIGRLLADFLQQTSSPVARPRVPAGTRPA